MPGQLLGVDLGAARWMPRAVRLTSGTTMSWISVPTQEANALLGGVVRLVADLPRDASPELVWTSGADELLVHTARTTLACNVGVLTVGLLVDCEQVDGPVAVTVPFATGTAEDTRGLFMAAFEKPGGPSPVVDAWADALTAFGWECLLTLATELCAAAGKDRQERPLVPAAIGSARGQLLVLPMVRNG